MKGVLGEIDINVPITRTGKRIQQKRPEQIFLEFEEEIEEFNFEKHEIEAAARGALVLWLIEVVGQLEYDWHTLFLTIRIIDRFLSLCPRKIHQSELLCIGVSSLWIASKFQEVASLTLQDVTLRLSSNSLTESQITDMEREILVSLDFDFHIKTGYDAVNKLVRRFGLRGRIEQLAKVMLIILQAFQEISNWRALKQGICVIVLAGQLEGRELLDMLAGMGLDCRGCRDGVYLITQLIIKYQDYFGRQEKLYSFLKARLTGDDRLVELDYSMSSQFFQFYGMLISILLFCKYRNYIYQLAFIVSSIYFVKNMQDGSLVVQSNSNCQLQTQPSFFLEIRTFLILASVLYYSLGSEKLTIEATLLQGLSVFNSSFSYNNLLSISLLRSFINYIYLFLSLYQPYSQVIALALISIRFLFSLSYFSQSRLYRLQSKLSRYLFKIYSFLSGNLEFSFGISYNKLAG